MKLDERMDAIELLEGLLHQKIESVLSKAILHLPNTEITRVDVSLCEHQEDHRVKLDSVMVSYRMRSPNLRG